MIAFFFSVRRVAAYSTSHRTHDVDKSIHYIRLCRARPSFYVLVTTACKKPGLRPTYIVIPLVTGFQFQSPGFLLRGDNKKGVNSPGGSRGHRLKTR
jgi:hypothetical protein